MSDPIDRRAAIETIKNYCENGCDIEEDNWCPSCQREQFIKLLKALPSAQPDRPKGHWRLDFAQNKMTCSECGRTFKGGFDLDNADNFCRHCGSDNRGERWIRMK